MKEDQLNYIRGRLKEMLANDYPLLRKDMMDEFGVSARVIWKVTSQMKNLGEVYCTAGKGFFPDERAYQEWLEHQREEKEVREQYGLRFVKNSIGNRIFDLARKSPVYHFDNLLRGVRHGTTC